MDRTTTMIGAALVALALSSAAAAAEIFALHTDHAGSVVMETDQDRNITWQGQYEPYGLPRQTPPEGPGYTGHVHDAASGLVYMQQRYYDPEVGRFLSVDPVGVNAADGANFNRYWYANNNPSRYADPDGQIPVETIWDAANVAMGVASAHSNFESGNVGAGIVDVAGVIVDVVATAVPYLPGGAGAVIKGAREAGSAAVAARGADNGADFVVTPGGVAVPTSQSRMTEGFEAAGIPSTSLPDGKGTSYSMPDGSNVRAMEPSGQAGRRASFTNSDGGPVTPDGLVPQPPRGGTPAENRAFVRERTHVDQKR